MPLYEYEFPDTEEREVKLYPKSEYETVVLVTEGNFRYLLDKVAELTEKVERLESEKVDVSWSGVG